MHMVPRVKDYTSLARKRPFHWMALEVARETTSKFQNRLHLTNSRNRNMVELLPIRLKTLSNQSINQSINQSSYYQRKYI